MDKASPVAYSLPRLDSKGLEEPLDGKLQNPLLRKPPKRSIELEPLLTAEDVAKRLNVSTDWVWDHSSRKKPLLPVIRMGDGALRYRASGIEAFIDERERMGAMRRRAG
jgi:predicted DNA-binding transcriptional regulator AlpA